MHDIQQLFSAVMALVGKKCQMFLNIMHRHYIYINLLLAFLFLCFFEVLPKYKYKLIHTSKSFDVSFCIIFNDFSVHLWHWLEKSVKFFRYNSQVLHKPTFGFFISLRSYPNTIISLSTLQRVSMYLSADYSMTFQCSCGIG